MTIVKEWLKFASNDINCAKQLLFDIIHAKIININGVSYENISVL